MSSGKWSNRCIESVAEGGVMESNRDGDYVCRDCKLVYQAYGDRLRCDICNKKLEWCNSREVEALLLKWE